MDPGFPWQARSVDVGAGERLAVLDEGAGPTVVFAHGTPTWSFEWRQVIARLLPTRRCVAPDHLGFGRSPRPVGADYSPEAHARRFSALLERLAIERYSLVVHDFGGPIALDGALAHPERLERLVVFNSIAWAFEDDERLRRSARWAGSAPFRVAYRHLNLSFVLARAAWGRAPRRADVWRRYTSCFPDAESRERVLFALARSLAGSTPFFRSLWERRGRLAHVPLLLVWGLRDTAFGPPVLARFREAWPRAEVLELADAGHWPHEEEPARCAEAVAAFLGA